jgi:TRAP-type C4-dicarboxylate transport system permease small subunit
VSESADGDGSPGDSPDELEQPAEPPSAADGSAIPIETTVPPTRRQTAPPVTAEPPAPAEPPTALAALAVHSADGSTFPDDGPVSTWLRRADGALGAAEQAVLFFLLGAVVLTAATAALSDRLAGIRLGRWWFDIVRGGTFSVAMIGAVFASHQQRHLSMDLISRRLPPRGRLVLRVVLAVFTVLVAALLVRSGLHQLDTVGEEGGEHLISTHSIVMFMPIGAGLIILHTLLHMVIDLDYLARGKTPPARMRSGH